MHQLQLSIEAEIADQGNQNDEDEWVDIEQDPVLFNFTGKVDSKFIYL